MLSPLEILQEYWGHKVFKPSQEEVVKMAMAEKDVLALLPTGGGKSICYQIPALSLPGICIVVSPLIALMNDQVKQLKEKNIPAELISSAMSPKAIDIALDRCIYGETKFLYLSPERINSVIVKERVKRMDVNFIAVDEAHCISQWGHDFRPAYRNIATLREWHPYASIIAVTATATPKVAKDIVEQLGFENENIVKTSFLRPKLAFSTARVEDKKKEVLHEVLHSTGSGIVYVRSRKLCEELNSLLTSKGISSEYYHAGVNAKTRSEVETRWLKGKTHWIIATNAFGMGIDKANVRKVIHYGIPGTLEEYIQESGRAGRDGKPADAVIIYNGEDLSTAKKMLNYRFPAREEIKGVYRAVGNYTQTAVGGGQGTGFEFDIQAFARRFKFHVLKVHHSLRLLEAEGYLFLSDDTQKTSRVHILQSRKAIESLVENDNWIGNFVSVLLRSYTGIFQKPTRISESGLAETLGVDEKKIKQTLEILEKQEVLQYRKKSFHPTLFYAQDRLTNDALYIPKDHLEVRKDFASKQLEAMIGFVEEQVSCRANYALFYFGETPKGRCGVCDNCLGEQKHDVNPEAFILGRLSNGPTKLAELVESAPYPQKTTLATIRTLIGEKAIRQQEDGYLGIMAE